MLDDYQSIPIEVFTYLISGDGTFSVETFMHVRISDNLKLISVLLHPDREVVATVALCNQMEGF